MCSAGCKLYPILHTTVDITVFLVVSRMSILHLRNIQSTSKPAKSEENTAYVQNLVVISSPTAFFKCRNYCKARFSTDKVNMNERT